MKVARTHFGRASTGYGFLRWDKEVTSLEPLNKDLVKWIWYNTKDDVIDSTTMSDDDKEIILHLLLKGYLVKKSGKIFCYSELGSVYYERLKAHAKKLAAGIPARDKPVMFSVDKYLKVNWLRGQYNSKRRFLTDGKVVICSTRIFGDDTLRVPKRVISKCPVKIEKLVRTQVSSFLLELDRAPKVEPYKFQRLDMFSPGKVWFKEKDGFIVHPMAEFYYDYIYAYSNRVIIDDTVKVVPYNGMTIFVFQTERLLPSELFSGSVIAYIAGLKSKEGIN